MLTQRLLDWVEVSSLPKKLTVLLVLLGTVAVFTFWVVLGPRFHQANSLQLEVQLLDEALKTRNDYVHKRAKLSTEVSALRNRYQVLSEALGIPLPVTDVLSGISNAANKANVSLTLWKPDPPVEGPDMYRTATRLEVEGNYHGVTTFLDELARLPKALGVNAFTISALSQDQGEKTIKVSLNLLGV